MAKARYHKNQRVYVKPVGTWALIERVLPHWTKGLEEPIRIHYDVGLGREFGAEELQAEAQNSGTIDSGGENWRLIRARNKWQAPEDCTHHPYPGTFPTIVTNENDWGGWRVPGSEYDLDPHRIETQARMIVNNLRLLNITQRLITFVGEEESLPEEIISLAKEGESIIRHILDEHEVDENDIVEGEQEEDVDAA